MTLVHGDVRRSVRLRTQEIRDGCTPEVASVVLRRRHRAVQACAMDLARRTGAPPRGRVVAALTLDEEGWPQRTQVGPNASLDEEFEACLRDALRVRFPNPFRKRCTVLAPFTFEASTARP